AYWWTVPAGEGLPRRSAALTDRRMNDRGHPDEVGHGFGAHLFHHAGPVHLHGLLADAELPGDLLVEAPGHDEFEDFGFALREVGQALLELARANPVALFGDVPFQGSAHGVEQLLRAVRLRQEIHGAGPHRPDTHGNAAVAADEDDRQRPVTGRDGVLEVEAGDPGHADVEHEARGSAAQWILEEVSARREGLHFVSGRPQEPREALENGHVIVDDIDGGLRRRHATGSLTSG